MNDHFDAQEARDPARRERELMAGLPALIALAQQATGWAAILAGVDARDVATRTALAQLPVTRKSQLHELQAKQPPFAGLTLTAARKLRRLYMSPGPIFDPEGHGADWWRYARPMHAAGMRAGHIVQNCFSYHFTPAASMIEGGAARLGCTVIPAGIGQTEMQVQAMAQLRPDAYAGTPSFLKIIVEKARELGADISSLKRALVGAEALPPSLRNWLQQNGVPQVLQCYGSADIGNVAYETMTDGALNPGMVLDEDLILEIVRPGTGDPVPEGEVGEVLVTSFNADYPLIRFATGDLSAILPGVSPCGRTNTRIRGWLGRADQTVKVRAMFVHPGQVEEIRRRHPAILKARLVVEGEMGNDRMVLYCEVENTDQKELVLSIVDSIREVTKLRGEAKLISTGELQAEGRLIVDLRKFK